MFVTFLMISPLFFVPNGGPHANTKKISHDRISRFIFFFFYFCTHLQFEKNKQRMELKICGYSWDLNEFFFLIFFSFQHKKKLKVMHTNTKREKKEKYIIKCRRKKTIKIHVPSHSEHFFSSLKCLIKTVWMLPPFFSDKPACLVQTMYNTVGSLE